SSSSRRRGWPTGPGWRSSSWRCRSTSPATACATSWIPEITSAVRVHILGASGSGTTTLGAALAARLGHAHLDTDDFFWLPTEPKFLEIRPREERIALLERALDQAHRWVLSGSLCGWGDVFIPRFELVVFMYIEPHVRMARLARREAGRYGAPAVAPGGAHHA